MSPTLDNVAHGESSNVVRSVIFLDTNRHIETSLQIMSQFFRPRKRPRSRGTDDLQADAPVAKLARQDSGSDSVAAVQRDGGVSRASASARRAIDIRKYIKQYLTGFVAQRTTSVVQTRKRPGSPNQIPNEDSHRDKRIRVRSPSPPIRSV